MKPIEKTFSELKAHLRNNAERIRRLPDQDAQSLRRRLIC